MFILTTIVDLVQIPPHEFYKLSIEEIEDKVNEKFANKVIQNIGLCICMYDLLDHSEGLIGHGTGLVNVNVKFRMLVFRPFKGEIVLGRITSSSERGVKIGVEFFNDILVPPSGLMPDTEFNFEEQVWVCQNAETGESYYYDNNEIVRFRVETEEWHDHSPKGPGTDQETATEIARKAPYSISASMSGSGLGPTHWW